LLVSLHNPHSYSTNPCSTFPALWKQQHMLQSKLSLDDKALSGRCATHHA